MFLPESIHSFSLLILAQAPAFVADLSEILIPVITGLIGWSWGRQRATAKWKKREFFDRLNISLNIVEDGELKIRTLVEKRLEEVFLNSAARQTVLCKAQETSAEDSILPLAEDEYWYCLNPVLNEISERFAAGHIKRDMGLPINSMTYVVCITCEVSGEMRQRKVRAMMMQKAVIENFPETLKVSEPHHNTRVKTLRQLAAEYAKNPHRFIELEVCL